LARYGIYDFRQRKSFEGRDTMFSLERRECIDDGGVIECTDGPNWWYTNTARIVKWVVFFGIFGAFIAFMVFGRMHARRRIRKGLAPLAYHRWLLNREERARYDPNFQNPQAVYSTYRPQQYGMETMPPPVYDHNAPPPPTYQPPAGSSKVDPSQWRTQPTRRPDESNDSAPEYTPPAGPPPPAVQANHTGASASSSNPYRL